MLTAEQLAMRRTGIGSSDIAAVVGKSPYGTAFDVYLSKTEGTQIERTFAMELGDLLEDPILTLYERRMGPSGLVRHPGTFRHPKLAFVVDSPDAIATFGDERRPVEAKTSRFADVELWGEEGTDEVPENYLIQAQWHMIRERAEDSSVKHCDVPVLIKTDEFRIYRVGWDEDLAGVLIEEGARFWRNHVEAGVPPDISGSRSVHDWLAKKFPRDNGEMLKADIEAEALLRELLEAEVQKDLSKDAFDALKAKIQLRIADASGIASSWAQATWKKAKDGKKVDWESVARSVAASPEVLSEAIKANTAIVPGSKRFLMKLIKAAKAA